MKNKILILLPTRERPKKTHEAIQAWLKTKTAGKSDLVLGLDIDDPTLSDYIAINKQATFINIGPRVKMCPTVNRLVKQFPDYKYYAFIGDDHVFRTKGWDEMMINKIEQNGGIGVCYGDDKLQGETLASAFVISKTFVDLQGGYIPDPRLIHMCMDNQVMILARQFGKLFYIPEIIIEHMHYTTGKSKNDAMYASVNNNIVLLADQKVLSEWRTQELPKIITKYKEERNL